MSLVGDIADKASSALGGDAPKPAAMKQAKAKFVKGEPVPIDEPQGNAPGSTALAHPNVFDPKMPVEFVHFGHVHTDVHDVFNHDQELDDTKADALKDLPTGARAIAFRAALQREAILLDGFIGSLQSLLKEAKDSSGAADKLVGAATDLLSGGSKKGAGAPDPAQLDPYKKGAGEAGAKANKAEIQYKEIHQAGIDLHQVRANFLEFAPELNKRGDDGGGLLGNLPATLPIPPIPGVGDISKTVMGIIFKMFDIHKAMFYQLRAKYEPAIEKACYDRSLKAIRERSTPIFDVWSIPPPPDNSKSPQAEKILDVQKTGLDALDGVVDEVNGVYSDVNQKVEDTKRKWREFWGEQPEPGPGQAELESIFAAVPDPEEWVLRGFCEGLGIGSLPGFISKAIGKVIKTNAGIIQQLYIKLQDPVVAKNIDEQAVLAAGRIYLAGVIRGILQDLLPAFSVGPGEGVVNKDMVAGKGASLVDELIGKHLKPILHIAMGGLHDKLAEARKAAAKNNCDVMECYLALLPQMIAISSRNTFFPIWQLVVEELFGRGAAAAALATSPVNKLMEEGRTRVKNVKKDSEELGSDISNKANETADDVKKKEAEAQKTLSQYNVTAGSPAGQAADSASKGVGGAADSIFGTKKDPAAAAGTGASFPGATRLKTGKGKNIEADEWQEVTDKQQVVTA